MSPMYELHRLAYGDKTPATSDILMETSRLPLFRTIAETTRSDVSALVDTHLALLKARGAHVPTVAGVRIIEGPLSELSGDWEFRGEEWRAVVGQDVEAMRTRYGSPEYRNRLAPPLWPHKHLPNVFGAVLVATPEMYARCQEVARDPEESRLAWLVVATVETWVDSLLFAELFRDLDGQSPLDPLFKLCRKGVVPVGWDEGVFWSYRFKETHESVSGP